METLKLNNPIKINGKEVSELTYDVNEITCEAFIDAEYRKFGSASKKGVNAAALEMDYSMQLQLGFAAILAVNRDIDYTDLERLKGTDLMQVMRIGRNFTVASAEQKATDSESSSDEE